MDEYSITQYGKPLSTDKYSIDLENKTVWTSSHYLVLDFYGLRDWTFETGDNCIFKTGSHCTFKTGLGCTFKTGKNCTFTTDVCCIFDTGGLCIFDTRDWCVFNTGSGCTLNTGDHCTFVTCGHSTFFTGNYCTFATGYNCTFYAGDHCIFSIWGINSCTFKYNEFGDLLNNGIILDNVDNKHYVLSREFVSVIARDRPVALIFGSYT